MDFLTLAKRRQSTRSFDSHAQVSREDLDYCLEASRMAPSACNAQPYTFYVCEGETGKAVARATQGLGMNRFAGDAPVLIVLSEAAYNLTAAAGSAVKGRDYRTLDIGIAAAHFTLAAAQRGLGTCILGWFDQERIQDILGIGQPVRLVIALGHPKGELQRTKKRKSAQELVRYRK